MEETNTKEINLLQLINLFFNWLLKIGKSILDLIVYLVQLAYRHKSIVLISISICLVFGLYFSRPSAKVYKAEAMAMLYGSETQTVKEVSKQLENSVGSNNLFSLATKLSLPDSVARNIVGIQSFFVIDYLKDGVADMVDFKNNHSLTDTLNLRMKDRIYLQIKTTNISQIPKVQAAIHKAVEEAWRIEAKAVLPKRVSELAGKFGFKYQEVFVKNAKTRWGSCSHNNRINLSLHLMMLPDHLIDYVILHELTHTIHKNHGPKFWLYLDQITGGVKKLEKEINSKRIGLF